MSTMKENIIQHTTIDKADERQWFQHLTTLLTRDVTALLKISPDEGLRWIDTQVDLIDVANIVWETGNITDNTGRPLFFREIVHGLFTVLHMSIPNNIYSVRRDALRRKGFYVEPIRTRYIKLIKAHVVKDPFLINIQMPRLRSYLTDGQKLKHNTL